VKVVGFSLWQPNRSSGYGFGHAVAANAKALSGGERGNSSTDAAEVDDQFLSGNGGGVAPPPHSIFLMAGARSSEALSLLT